MARKKHKGPHEEHADESWLLPYSDMMTLLLALFIVMFAFSSVDKEKYNALMESMYTAFGGTTDVGSPIPVPYPTSDLPSQSAMEEAVMQNFSAPISNFYQSMNDYIGSNDLSGTVSVEYEGDGLLVVMKSDVFFEPGSAEMSEDMKEQAHKVAELLRQSQDASHPFDVIVAGHTDNIPMNNSQYASNWHLSVQRAVNFMTEILNNSDLDPTHFSSRGYGEHRPIATNDTAEGRRQNRRVELLITQESLETGNNSAGGASDPRGASAR